MSQKPLDVMLVATIQQVVDDKVQKNEMFTAFDVSRAVQHLGHRERHNNMKDVVHDYFLQGNIQGYDRTLVTVVAGKPDAWVYHPVGVDATTYQPSYQPLPAAVSGMTPQNYYGSQGTVAPSGATASTPSISSVTFSPPAKGKTHRPDKRGAITVPAKLIRQIGGKHNDELSVEKDGTTLVISPNGAGRKYRVNSSLNIRIKRKTWGSITNGSTSFSFEEDNGKIVVKSV